MAAAGYLGDCSDSFFQLTGFTAVIPAQAGIHPRTAARTSEKKMAAGLRRHDAVGVPG